jgi:ribosomal protein S21
LGVDDFDGFVLEHAKRMLDRQQQLAELQQRDPYEYQRTVERQADERAARKLAWERQQTQDGEARRAAEEYRVRAETIVADALKEVGVKASKKTMDIAAEIWREHQEVGYKLSVPDLAAMTKQRHLDELRAELDARDEDGLLELLGDDRRAKLRELEIARAKGERKAAKEAAPAAPERRDNTPAPVRGISEKDFTKHFGRPRAS